MKDYKLKMILSMLAGVVFALVFIFLALVLPTHDKEYVRKLPKGLLEEVSQHLKK